MISFLKGKIIHQSSTSLTLLTSGVGYLVFISPKTSAKLKKAQEKVALHIHTHVREDQLSLFGFLDQNSLDIFSLLLSVSGIGPKIALAIESVANPAKIKSAIQAADVDFFTAIPGLGKKSAQRIIIDLKSKLGELKELDLAEKASHTEALDALKSLGLSAKEATKAIQKVKNKDQLSQEDIIRQALKNLKK